jgi:hypothetical protein
MPGSIDLSELSIGSQVCHFCLIMCGGNVDMNSTRISASPFLNVGIFLGTILFSSVPPLLRRRYILTILEKERVASVREELLTGATYAFVY